MAMQTTHMTELMKYIEQEILPQYETFDGGHKRDHAEAVIRESLILAREHNANEQMVYVIAAYHDLGLRFDRETHHIRSGEILMADSKLRQWFTEEQLLTMRDAVEDHRASGKNPPRTIYGAIVAEADRQIIPETVIARTMAYSAKLYPNGDFETLYTRSREHLLEKYAEGGYMRLWLNSERNVRSLEQLRAIIRNEPQLRSLCGKWYITNISDKTMAIQTIELLRSSQTWDGAPLPDYPVGKPELIVKRLVFPAGAKTEWHHHTVINYGIIQQGELTIVCADGAERTFHAGEAMIEVIGTVHRGENRGSEPVILDMFYASSPGAEITISHPERV